jgi:hypothetical protein
MMGACGGGDSSSGTDVVSAPEAEQALEEHLAAVNKAIATNDCEANVEQQFSQTRSAARNATEAVEPGAPATAAECPSSGSGGATVGPLTLSNLGGLKLSVTEESGPAAVSEGTASKAFKGYGHFGVISMVDRDGMWRYLTFYQVRPQSEAPSSEADPGAVVDQFLAAVRKGDCANADAIFDPLGRLAGAATGGLRNPGGAKTACEAVVKGAYFAPSLKETPEADVKPEELLTTRDISIWGVPTKEAYYAVFLATPPTTVTAPPSATFLVSDVSLLTEAEPG